ncbi:MAG TPA: iron-sulfur cluster assembly accessory protein [Steroidobacteraceae bacterium]|nr:iron-sulfur cluster assembly accessory protein [Steroidobacteraceae bacterium]
MDTQRRALTLSGSGTLLEALLAQGVEIAHDCEGTLACGACRLVVRRGAEALEPASEDELDMLDRSFAHEAGARLACQATGAGDVEVEIPLLEALAVGVAGTVKVTPRAGAHFAAQLARHPGAVAVRLAVVPAGCSGLRYRVEPALSVAADDAVFEAGPVRIAVDPLSLPYVQGTLVDLAHQGLARKLRFDNPNARQSCGCGESFSA